uniref:G protein-coupled receptor 155b n=1 Tax=Astyanax mexicanus TaxID=7994 RepID=A0A8B9LU55_ASTMX
MPSVIYCKKNLGQYCKSSVHPSDAIMEGHYVAIHGLNITHNPQSPPAMSIGRLFPALLECFGIMLCGYVAGCTGVVGAGQVKGLGSFVSCFALPALLFKNMVQLQFEDVVWSFLWSVLIAKVCVFVLVCVLTLLVADPESRYGKAGLFSIFTTQSNDFALGYPIVEALYRSSHPDYGQYLYLVAPVSLMLLNPVGFALCELQRWRQSPDHSLSKLHIISTVVLRVIKNPIVFMVAVGIVCHFLFGGRVPVLIAEFVDGLADSFGGAALFYLGLTMVGQMHKLTRTTGVTLIMLITAKLLVMPLMCKDMLELLDAGNSSSANHSSLSDYAFLYGVFPTAPSVAIYASQYNMQLEVVTSGMVISTLLSAPIMYLSAWLLTIPWMEATHLISELQEVSFNISIISLIALVWTVAVMLLSKKFRRLPHMFSTNLFLAQLLVCVSMILWKFVVHQDNVLAQILTFTLLYGSLYSTYVWTGKTHTSLFTYQSMQEITRAVIIQKCCAAGTLALCVCLCECCMQCYICCFGVCGCVCVCVVNVLSLLSPAGAALCEAASCVRVQEERQVARHVLLCLLLIVSLLANLSSCLWWLLNTDPGRLYLELQFFCAVANYGQGFISFGIFGLDEHLIILPFKKRLAALWGGGQEENGGPAAVPEEIRLTCTQFVRYHKNQCVQDIVHKRRSVSECLHTLYTFRVFYLTYSHLKILKTKNKQVYTADTNRLHLHYKAHCSNPIFCK